MTKEEKFTNAEQGGAMKSGQKCSSPDKPIIPNNTSESTKPDTSKKNKFKKMI